MAIHTIEISGNCCRFDGQLFRCAIGKGGFSELKREGDGSTPIGSFNLRECWYRADRMDAPGTGLPLRSIMPEDGWCDDPASGAYNRAVKLPFAASHERLWRDDGIYNVIVPLGYNDNPVIAGKGSAIFLHVARRDYSPTKGCVALKLEDLLTLLAGSDQDTIMKISGL